MTRSAIRNSLAGLLVLVTVAAVPVSAQRGQPPSIGQRGQPPPSPPGQRGRGPQPTFRANVDLVQVDVVVLDKEGNPVHGLTRDDFRILDRQRPQTIAAFQEISHDHDRDKQDNEWIADVPRDVADNSTGRSERLVVLAIDDLVPSDRFPRIKELARQVVTELGKDASMALLTSSEARKVEVTDDLSLLLDQIDKIAERSAVARRVPRTTSAETGNCAPLMFEQAARMLGPEDTRRKAFVYISPYCATNVAGILSSMAEDPTNALGDSNDYIRMIESMRKANVAMYAIDPRGAQDFSLGHFEAPDIVSRSDNSGTTAWRQACATRSCDPVLISQDNLRQVSAATGGFAITNTNDFRAGLARLVDDFDHYYLLGFTPADRTGKGFRPIEVTVNRPGVTLRYRRGYSLGDPPALPKNKDPMVQLSAGVLPRSALALRLFATPLPSVGKTTRVAVTLEIRPPQRQIPTQVDDLAITILAVDLKKAKVSKEFVRPRRVLVPRQADGATGVNYQIVTSVDLSPGLYQLRASVKSSRIGEAGSVYDTVNVPDYSKTALALGGLVVGYADVKRHAAAVTVMDADTLPFEPVLDRTFASGEGLRLAADLWRRDPTRPVDTKVELLDEPGRLVTSMNRKEPAGRPNEQGSRIDLTFSLDGLAPGPYRVRLTVTDGALSDTREIGVVVK